MPILKIPVAPAFVVTGNTHVASATVGGKVLKIQALSRAAAKRQIAEAINIQAATLGKDGNDFPTDFAE